MLLDALRPSKTTVAEPRNVLPLAFAGISQVHVTWPPCTRAVVARSRALPARPRQVTRPFRMTAPVSERAASMLSAMMGRHNEITMALGEGRPVSA